MYHLYQVTPNIIRFWSMVERDPSRPVRWRCDQRWSDALLNKHSIMLMSEQSDFGQWLKEIPVVECTICTKSHQTQSDFGKWLKEMPVNRCTVEQAQHYAYERVSEESNCKTVKTWISYVIWLLYLLAHCTHLAWTLTPRPATARLNLTPAWKQSQSLFNRSSDSVGQSIKLSQKKHFNILTKQRAKLQNLIQTLWYNLQNNLIQEK